MNTHTKEFLKILQELEKLDSEFPLHYAICLAKISLKEGLSLTDLSKDVGLTLSTVSRIIGALSNSRQRGEAYQLVEVKISEKEKRKKEIFLTPKGKHVIQAINNIIAA